MSTQPILSNAELVERIRTVRGHRVILDADVAALYGVPTARINEQVKRNIERFPDDFMFQLTPDEVAGLRSQSAISNGRGGRRYAPYAFTEQGVAMLSSVLSSAQAIAVNIAIIRAFVQLRRAIALNADLAERLVELEGRVDDHDGVLVEVLGAVRELLDKAAAASKAQPTAPPPSKKSIGF